MWRGWVLACAAGLALLPANAVGARKTVIHVTRHYDTPAGERDPALLAAGQARAQALLRWFRGRPLAAIYVTDFQRTRATVAPLAAARGLTPIVYGPAPSPEFLAQLKTAPGPVLVVGHSNTAPDIVAGVGGDRPAPLAHEDFGDLWTVAAGRTRRVRIAP